ncbi:unnamed protein product [Spirodela intermedia]|uniref:Uncharacterized protein n=1 Tax=Spirodela intermedia TaxID=51605 RepID=A0A7I8KF74_SPIIN|nr:unnamed protein product [Spirodela intermedia]
MTSSSRYWRQRASERERERESAGGRGKPCLCDDEEMDSSGAFGSRFPLILLFWKLAGT